MTPHHPLRAALAVALAVLSACLSPDDDRAEQPPARPQVARADVEITKVLRLRETTGTTTRIHPVIVTGDAAGWSSGLRLLCDDCARAFAAFGLPLQAVELAPIYDSDAELRADNGIDGAMPIVDLPIGVLGQSPVIAAYRVVDATPDAGPRYLVRLRAAPERLYATDCASFLEVAQGSLDTVPVNKALLAYWRTPAQPPRIGCSSLGSQRLPQPAPAEPVSMTGASAPVVDVWRARRPHQDVRAGTYLYLVTQAADGTRRGFPIDCGSESLNVVRALGFDPAAVRADFASDEELSATGWERNPVIRCPGGVDNQVLAITSSNDLAQLTRFKFEPRRHVFAFTCREAESFFRARARSQLEVPLQAAGHLSAFQEGGEPTEVVRIDCRDAPADACARTPEPGFMPLFSGATSSLRGFRLPGSAVAQVQRCELALGGGGTLWYLAEHLPAAYTLRLDWLATSVAASGSVIVGWGHPSLGPAAAYGGAVEVAIAPGRQGTAATGAINRRAPPTQYAEHLIGQWNTYELQVSESKVALWLNGRLVNDHTLPDGGRLRSPGFIALSSSSDLVTRFRNLRVRLDRPVGRFGTLTTVDGQCGDVWGRQHTDGTRLQLFPCHGGHNQDFTMPGDGTLRTLGKCLDRQGDLSAETGVQVVQIAPCNGLPRQHWTAREDGSIVNGESGHCLDSQHGAAADETPMVTRLCQRDQRSQRWRTPSTAARVGLVQNVARGCMDIAGYNHADGAAAQIFDCHGALNQYFTLPGDGTLRVMGKCIDRSGPLNARGDTRFVQLRTCTASADQTFIPQPDATLLNPATGLCLDIEGGVTKNETWLVTTACNGSPSQRWSIPFLGTATR